MDEEIAPELDMLLNAIILVIKKTLKTKTKTMSWKPWNHQLLWRLQIESPEVGPKWKSLTQSTLTIQFSS